jgi:mRNA-degrading endonuclease RelE of RelBE toxin-antitoxin system
MRLKQTPDFVRNAKRLTKKYFSLPQELADLGESLKKNPTQGESLGKDCYKIRLKIKSKNKGKSGGSRVITCVKIVDETVHLLTIFDKSDKEDLAQGELDDLLSQIA